MARCDRLDAAQAAGDSAREHRSDHRHNPTHSTRTQRARERPRPEFPRRQARNSSCRAGGQSVTRPCGVRKIGADKGYTEVFTDSDGQRHGLELGKLLTAKSDANKIRYQGRQTLAALADKHLVKGRYRKYERIVQHNLGKQKAVRQKAHHRAVIRTKVFTATHTLIDKASVLVVEDLSRPIVRYDREFGRFTPYQKVREMLEQRFRLATGGVNATRGRG